MSHLQAHYSPGSPSKSADLSLSSVDGGCCTPVGHVQVNDRGEAEREARRLNAEFHAEPAPGVIVAADAGMTVVALDHAAMREAVKSWPKLQPRPVLPPPAQQLAELDRILTSAREQNARRAEETRAAFVAWQETQGV